MSREPSVDRQVAELLVQLCDGGRMIPTAAGDRQLSAGAAPRLVELAEQHGLSGLATARAGRLADDPCLSAALPALRHEYLVQSARSLAGLHQLEQISRAFAQEGIGVIALKGAAAILSIYSHPGLRRIDDLDLLIRGEDVPRATEVLAALGLEASGSPRVFSSAEEEQVAALRREHLYPFTGPNSFPVELHVNLMRSARREAVLPDVWREAVVLPAAGGVRILSPSHFLIHTSVHYLKHLERGFAPLKAMADLTHAIRNPHPEPDWPDVWRVARRWGVLRETAVVMATLNEHWALGIPGVPPGVAPLPLEALVREARSDSSVAGPALIAGPWQRMRRTQLLPGVWPKVRYVFRLLAPVPAYIRRRYALADDTPVAPYYVRRLLGGAVRLGRELRSVARDRAARGRG